MTAVHRFVEAALDAWLAPVHGLPSSIGLVAVALPTTIVMLLLFKWTTAQRRLAAVKRRMHAGLLELRLFNDDLVAIARTSLDLVGQSIAFVRLSILPLALALVPVTVLLAHLHARYAYAGLRTGESAVVTVRLEDGVGAGARRPALDVQVPNGLRMDTEALWSPSLREASWRLTAVRRGDYSVRVTVDGEAADKRVMVADAPVPRSVKIDDDRRAGQEPVRHFHVGRPARRVAEQVERIEERAARALGEVPLGGGERDAGRIVAAFERPVANWGLPKYIERSATIGRFESTTYRERAVDEFGDRAG